MDRNLYCELQCYGVTKSPPARVAWIETVRCAVQWRVCVVATREGGVDRNVFMFPAPPYRTVVATREGGVDRNCRYGSMNHADKMSPPARVAWIETQGLAGRAPDRPGSPPARVAWIETGSPLQIQLQHLVATREGGVDRNKAPLVAIQGIFGRHPRGWRG